MESKRKVALFARGLRRSHPTHLGLRRQEVLLGIDLELAAGGALGLAGPNGSGKSTLLRILAGIDPASGGEICVLGGDPGDPAIRARIGYLPEDSAFPPEMRALQALELLGALQGKPRARVRERARALLERVGLAEHGKKPLGRFSRGMLRRFGLAQAVLHEPELLLLDEPTAGLDAPGFLVLDEILREARARGTSVVLASHVASDLSRASDELAVILDGRIAVRGPPHQVLAGRSLLELYAQSSRATEPPSAASTGPSAASTGPSAASTGPSAASTGPSEASTGPSAASTGPSPASTGPSEASANASRTAMPPDRR